MSSPSTSGVLQKDTCELVGTEHCCDVCAVTTEEKDMQEEMQAVVHSVQSLSNEGEKKVSMAEIKSYTYIYIYVHNIPPTFVKGVKKITTFLPRLRSGSRVAIVPTHCIAT